MRCACGALIRNQKRELERPRRSGNMRANWIRLARLRLRKSDE